MHTEIEQVAIELVEANARRYNALKYTNAYNIADGECNRLMHRLEEVVLDERADALKGIRRQAERDQRMDEHGMESPLTKFKRVWNELLR